MFNLEEYLSELELLVNIESGMNCPDEQRKVAEFFKEKFDSLGWKTTLHDIGEVVGPMLSCVNREAEKYDLMMVGHIDTVFPRGMLEKNPYRIEGDKICGLGVADMKQGALMMYHIVKNLSKDILDKLNIAIVFNPDEEIGSMYSRPAYKSIAEKSKYCYIYEAMGLDGKRTIQRKGAFGLSVDFIGVEGHTGAKFTNGSKSAIHEMAYWITEFLKLESRERDITVNVGLVNGGKAVNIVAGNATLGMGIRFYDVEVKKEILETLYRLEAHAEENGIKLSYSKNRFISPLFPTEEGKKYASHVEKIAKSVDPNFYYKPSPGLSDANQIADFGPIIIDSLGPAGGKLHTDEEFLYLNSIETSFKISCIMIEDLYKNKV